MSSSTEVEKALSHLEGMAGRCNDDAAAQFAGTIRDHIRTLEAQRDEAYHWLKIARHFAALHMSTNPNAAELVDYIAEVTDE